MQYVFLGPSLKKAVLLFLLLVTCLPVYATEVQLPGARISYSALATADFNGDGYKEIVAGGSDGMLYVISTNDGVKWFPVWNHQCNIEIEAANPPTHKDTNEIFASPAIADLDNDGHLDIVVAMGGNVHVDNHDDSLRDNGGILVFRYNGSWDFALIESLSADGSRGWPQPRIDRVGLGSGYSYPDGYWDGIMTTPALGDLDGDGDLEIVVAGIDRRIHAWHHTGEAVSGWPIYRGNGDALLRGGISSPALADIDRDGRPEVIVATQSPPWDQSLPITTTNPDYTKGTLWAINGDSSNVPGFPVPTEQYFLSSPAIGDVDNDGYFEIVIGSGRAYGSPPIPTGRDNIVSVFNHDGSMLTGWPKETVGYTRASPGLADLDNDGIVEIVIGCGSGDSYKCDGHDGVLYAWNADGSSVRGFPVSPPSASLLRDEADGMPYTPVMADIDGDGGIEILIVETFAWGITLVDTNGATTGYRQTMYGLQAPPVVDDIDNDGNVEILVGGGDTNAVINIWDENGDYDDDLASWPMQRGNLQRTATIGNVGFLSPPPGPLFGTPIPSVYSLLLKAR
jgi:hypothetical protein